MIKLTDIFVTNPKKKQVNEENHPLKQVSTHAMNIGTIRSMMVDTYLKKKDPAIHLGDLEKEAKALLNAIKKAK